MDFCFSLAVSMRVCASPGHLYPKNTAGLQRPHPAPSPIHPTTPGKHKACLQGHAHPKPRTSHCTSKHVSSFGEIPELKTTLCISKCFTMLIRKSRILLAVWNSLLYKPLATFFRIKSWIFLLASNTYHEVTTQLIIES